MVQEEQGQRPWGFPSPREGPASWEGGLEEPSEKQGGVNPRKETHEPRKIGKAAQDILSPGPLLCGCGGPEWAPRRAGLVEETERSLAWVAREAQIS